jgi:hypothetical protein
MLSFTSVISLPGKNLQCEWDKRLGEPQKRSQHASEEKNLVLFRRLKTETSVFQLRA